MNNIGILLGALVIGLFFSGCQELIPQKVEQKIAIGDDGSMSVSYSGTFLDLYELIVFISKEEGVIISHLLKMLEKKCLSILKVHRL